MADSVDNCAFCAIAAGLDESVEIVAESDSWIAFFPLNPATPGHTLVVPKTHVRNLWDVEPPLDGELIRACIEVGRAIEGALDVDGMNLITSAGETAEQSVFHLHLHVVPRWSDDGFGEIWPAGGRYENSDLENVAERIRVAWSGRRLNH